MEPISTYVDFGEREFLVADERGYEYLLYKMAEDFLFTSEGKILDNRLKLNKVYNQIQLFDFFCFTFQFVLILLIKLFVHMICFFVTQSLDENKGTQGK